MRYLLVGGGTGGHIYPALTIAEALREIDPQAAFLYVGTAGGQEAQVVPRAGLPFATVSSGGLINLSLLQKVAGLLQVARGLFEAVALVRRFRPDVIVGTGGFVCGPVYLAALLLGRPLAIQEQNAFPGVTNRIAARWARAVFVPFEEAKRFLPGGARVMLAGNPVRRAVLEATREEGRAAFGFTPDDEVLLIMGGSGGARDFNRIAAEAVKLMLAERPRLRVLHVTGERYHGQVAAHYGPAGSRLTVEPYLYNMPQAMAAADAGIFRAGAMTLAEVQVRRLPSILVPSPNVTHNHQDWNARALEARGAAVMRRESDLTPALLAAEAGRLLDEPERRAAIGRALGEIAEPEAARRIAESVRRLATRAQ